MISPRGLRRRCFRCSSSSCGRRASKQQRLPRTPSSCQMFVKSITLHTNKPTTHRRVPAIPQLRCVSPKSICSLHQISTLRCLNQGSSYSDEDIEWACTATDLPSTLRLGSTEVICEGYASADDPNVLRGSCGVEYRLVLTEEGKRQYPHLAGNTNKNKWFGGDDSSQGGGETDWAGYIFAVIFFAVLGWIVYSACVQADANRRNPRRPAAGGQRRGWGGGGGGGGFGGGGGWGPGFGGGGGWDDPPPPYSKTTGDNAAAGGWRPGFWTGLAGGAAAAYMAGNRGNNGGRQQQSSYYDGGRGGGGLFGGSNRQGSSSSSGSSSSTARHESTGFGSTSRR
ncbi:transmembrane protein [Apodospora peruviana]|uniref:Store-operated calcium entry-associated regulatory factor n=1 Tax=Apodospora peruviana TaxID=516989 RepID=A0AAE0IBZ4_9PEZI|nr:transmembrane protein [Apodospora peruviana]